jgi:hypothetical protein
VLIGNNGNSACGAIKKNFDLFLVGGTFWSLILAYLNNFFSLSLFFNTVVPIERVDALLCSCYIPFYYLPFTARLCVLDCEEDFSLSTWSVKRGISKVAVSA